MQLGEFQKVKKIIGRFNLIDRESQFLKNYVSFPYFKWFLSLANHKEGNITEVKFWNGIRREIDRLRATYQVEPSERVVSLLEAAMKRSI